MIIIFFEGAIYNKDRGTWKTVVRIKGKQKHLCHVPDPVSAHIIYKIANEELELEKRWVKRCKWCNRIITPLNNNQLYCDEEETGRRCYSYAMQERWLQKYHEYKEKYWKKREQLGTSMGYSTSKWYEWQETMLKDMYLDGKSRGEIAMMIGKSVRAVERKLKFLRDTGRV